MVWVVSFFTFLIIDMLLTFPSTCQTNYSDCLCSVLSVLSFAANFKCHITYSAQCLQYMNFRRPLRSKKATFVETTSVRLTATKCQQIHVHCLSDLHFSSVEELFLKNRCSGSRTLLTDVNEIVFLLFTFLFCFGKIWCRNYAHNAVKALYNFSINNIIESHLINSNSSHLNPLFYTV
jgi:hypothetical protein